MGLAMAGACAKHRPCYWFQTHVKRRVQREYKFAGVTYLLTGKDNNDPVAGAAAAKFT